jgi:capsular polysaccharide biosynthesis protein
MHTSLLHVLRTAWYYRVHALVIIALTVAATLFAGIVVLKAKPSYTARTVVTMLPSPSELQVTSHRYDFTGVNPVYVLTQTHTEFLMSPS